MHKHDAIVSIEQSRLAARQVKAKTRSMIDRIKGLRSELEASNEENRQRLAELEQLVKGNTEDDDG